MQQARVGWADVRKPNIYLGHHRPMNVGVRTSPQPTALYAKRGQFWHRLKTAGIKILANPLAVSLTRPVIAAFLERT